MSTKHLITLFICLAFLILGSTDLAGQSSGEVVYKRTFPFGENIHYFDTLRFNEGGLLYLEKRKNTNHKTTSGYDFKIGVKDESWYLDLGTFNSLAQIYTPKAKGYLLTERKEERIDWQLHDEYKMIGKYKVQKATAEHPRSEFGQTIVWFTTAIPVSGGPERLWGLPGLILEREWTAGDFKGGFTMESITFKPVGKLKPSEGELVKGDMQAKGRNKSDLKNLLNRGN